MKGNLIAWGLVQQMNMKDTKEMFFRNSEWGPEGNMSTIEEIYNFPTKEEGILGDLIDTTDKDLIYKVYLE